MLATLRQYARPPGPAQPSIAPIPHHTWSRCCMMGSPKASVLPLPVCAAPMMSLWSLRATGRTAAWMGVGWLKRCTVPKGKGATCKLFREQKFAAAAAAAATCPAWKAGTWNLAETEKSIIAFTGKAWQEPPHHHILASHKHIAHPCDRSEKVCWYTPHPSLG